MKVPQASAYQPEAHPRLTEHRPETRSSRDDARAVVSLIAFDSGIRVLELTETSRSLEDSLLDMTRSSAQFASN